MATNLLPEPITFDQYLELEEKADFKSEYRAGEVFAMSGGTEPHARLIARVAYLLSREVGNKCRVYSSELKLYVAGVNESMYPDGMALCGEPEFYKNRKDVIVNPTLVVEVLSPSTKYYDGSFKTRAYRTIPSLQHCLLIDSESVYVQLSSRHGDRWILTESIERSRHLDIGDLVAFTLEEVYNGIL
ncbi:MAG: Uma2 family endonuclease [Acidobacteriaceae bacterium]|nr:Uma2 family endonuclease [Acidobacteriaceae bacterium]